MEQSKFYQIKNITEQEYTLVGCDGSVITRPIRDVDKSASVFTIQDAKAGDVLNFDCGVGIFKNLSTDGYNAHCYCYYSNEGFLEINKDSLYDIYQSCPATKEQRDTLEKAMTDAGWKFDFDKKELKKIEQKPAEWSKEDIATISRVTSIVKWAAYSDHSHPILNDEGATELVERLKSLKDRVGCEAKCATTNEWSEEDEKIYQSIMDDTVQENQLNDKQTDWLRNIKYRNFARPQSTWKPSEGEMKALKEAVDEHFDIDGGALWHLYEDLKKLKV